MAPPRKYSTTELARALRAAPSVACACRLTGIGQAALRKRVKTDGILTDAYAACLARGMAGAGQTIATFQKSSDAKLRSALSKARAAGKLGVRS